MRFCAYSEVLKASSCGLPLYVACEARERNSREFVKTKEYRFHEIARCSLFGIISQHHSGQGAEDKTTLCLRNTIDFENEFNTPLITS
jgi:hypothetical protein